MKSVSTLLLLPCLVWCGVPSDGEALHYTLNWPSGLSLGEGSLKASRSGDKWSFELQFEAALPGFLIKDHYRSLVDASQCSLEFERDLERGKRKSKEKIIFDPVAGTAERETKDGGKSKLTVGPCAKDALAFIFHLRDELSKGRIPPQQNVYYGAGYSVRLQHKGTQRMRLGEEIEVADRLVATIKGPASSLEVEIFVGRDDNRTPMRVKIPVAMGEFTLELVR